MFPKVLLIFFAFAVAVSAKVISWTGYSEESQEAATEAARAGVAKQISVHIDASTSVTHSEITPDNGNSEIEKKIKSQNFSRSDLLLNGIRIQVLPKNGKRFGATATLDLDVLVSKYRFKLETLQRTINETETKARQALAEQRFVETDRQLATIPGIVKSQEPILEEMSLYTPLDNSMRLKTESAAIQQALTLALRQLQISVSKEGNPQELGPKSSFLLTVTNPQFSTPYRKRRKSPCKCRYRRPRCSLLPNFGKQPDPRFRRNPHPSGHFCKPAQPRGPYGNQGSLPGFFSCMPAKSHLQPRAVGLHRRSRPDFKTLRPGGARQERPNSHRPYQVYFRTYSEEHHQLQGQPFPFSGNQGMQMERNWSRQDKRRSPDQRPKKDGPGQLYRNS